MPVPGTSKAPSFSNDKPENLLRFFLRMEGHFKEDNITDGQEKKEKLVEYVDPGVDDEWKAFKEYGAAYSYDDFKTAVKKSYPSVAEAETASWKRLQQKVFESRNHLEVSQTEELSALIRMMRAEINKLKGITPPLCTNAELVRLFFTRLTPAFAELIVRNLRLQPAPAATAGVATTSGHKEDPYTIDAVFDMAISTSEESRGPLGSLLGSGSSAVGRALNPANSEMPAPKPRVQEAFAKFEEISASLKDSIDIQTRNTQALQNSMEKQLSLQTKLLTQQTQGLQSFLSSQTRSSAQRSNEPGILRN
ncbi:hypothetical protein CVT26_006522, partial [Gymnopilus dilepis]